MLKVFGTCFRRDCFPDVQKRRYGLLYSRNQTWNWEVCSYGTNSWRGMHDNDEGHLRYFLQSLALHKFQNCVEVGKCCLKYSMQFFECLGKQCLKYLELVFAETAFQMCKNVGMVYSIQGIKHETEKYVLMGHVASILFKHDLAQDCFLKSTKPELALEMRMDLQDWFQALKLAK